VLLTVATSFRRCSKSHTVEQSNYSPIELQLQILLQQLTIPSSALLTRITSVGIVFVSIFILLMFKLFRNMCNG